ncbi:hypothetical protein [Terricaulis sp.]|uniref:hypothetical protein n=1 Tax=Terricaulis sp. TaxID=2768686 RepID=UPI002AC54341|nr:hypothetical protein [Terricaulis sp.]MDZ4691972.1 hypothetical protein [Terricaulis sp.]
MLLAACATPERATADREPPLQLDLLALTLAEPSANDGGTRAQFLAMLGREDLFEQQERPTCAPLLHDGTPADPVEEIARQANGRRIVIINEAHERPQHRAFIASVATRLHRDGFSIYAAETFLPSVREPRAWPSINDGTYSRDPVFGDLIRTARGVGYRFVEYEDFSEMDETAPWQARIAQREATQAANLQHILQEHPQARVLVHVGHAHLLERPDSNGNIWMAQRLKEATGLDPLTIDLTRFAAPDERFAVCDPVITPSVTVDMRVASPDVTIEFGRPAWRQRAGQRITPVPPALVHRQENVIVEARRTDEPDEAVPVDRLLIRATETGVLLLPPGRFRVESWGETSGWSAPVEIVVQ